jgi:ribosomal protein S18 acetylase RimI-like enzyme
MNPVELTPATVSDIPQIAALAEKIWKVHYPPIIGMQQVEYMLDLMYSEKALREQMASGQEFFFIRANETVVGYLGLSFANPNEIFIHKFYIDSEIQTRGIGTAAFQELIRLYPKRNSCRLTVNRNNYKSINFYFKVGFVIEEVKDFDIGNGYQMNDFIMVWHRK